MEMMRMLKEVMRMLMEVMRMLMEVMERRFLIRQEEGAAPTSPFLPLLLITPITILAIIIIIMIIVGILRQCRKGAGGWAGQAFASQVPQLTWFKRVGKPDEGRGRTTWLIFWSYFVLTPTESVILRTTSTLLWTVWLTSWSSQLVFVLRAALLLLDNLWQPALRYKLHYNACARVGRSR